jgi:hypothetical protein
MDIAGNEISIEPRRRSRTVVPVPSVCEAANRSCSLAVLLGPQWVRQLTGRQHDVIIGDDGIHDMLRQHTAVHEP